MTVAIRAASAADVEAICAIHNQGSADRFATLDTTLKSPDDTRAWLAERGPRYPVFVADDDGRSWVASLNRFNPRPAYDQVADFSVYVERSSGRRDWAGSCRSPDRSRPRHRLSQDGPRGDGR